PVRRAGDAVQHPALPPGGVVNRARRLGEWLSGGAVRIVLTVVALLWLLPTAGLAVSSLRRPSDINSTGWWDALRHPSQLTIDNFRSLLENDRMTSAFWNTVVITVPSVLLVVLVAAF